MIKRLFDVDTYQKMGCPNLKNVVFFKKAGKKRYGKVVLIKHTGFKGKIQIGIEPYFKHKNK